MPSQITLLSTTIPAFCDRLLSYMSLHAETIAADVVAAVG